MARPVACLLDDGQPRPRWLWDVFGRHAYDERDVGTIPNKTLNGLPLAATTQRRRFERQRRALIPGTALVPAHASWRIPPRTGTRCFNVYGIEYKLGLDDAEPTYLLMNLVQSTNFGVVDTKYIPTP
ncbi:hypothetical protein FIBSPDRAFT_927697 [Athelia psychrophila]|uniref:Uncharacterized protein n=1 Tax=Athelia psychrophila TaxID=1759441 RepID=A0A166RI52_9AGAM|nr:hypothetical protein FIBSPDRAFT_927697 [Fibularhizoctonia sp. CBS 109695]